MPRAFLLLAFLAVVAAPSASAARASAPSAPAAIVIPTGETPEAWKPVPADGVDLKLSGDAGAKGRALRLDFDFRGGGGYAVAHRAVSLDLPDNWRFTFRVRGQCRPNNLEFKLVDASGDNVWWLNQRDFEFEPGGRHVVIRKRDVSFAWGPAGGGEPHHVAAIEFAVTAGQGGAGSVWIEDLRLQPMPAPDTTTHAIRASASSGGATAMRAVDGDPASAWTSDPKDERPTLTLDLGAVREFGGLTLDWLPGRHARDYDVDLSSDGTAWTSGHAVRGGNGGRDPVYLPGSEARYVRITTLRTADPTGSVSLANVAVKPVAWSATLDGFFAEVAKDAPRGSYPRATTGENVFWTVLGVGEDEAASLFDETGRVEPWRGSFSVEPFVRDRGRLVTWADAKLTPSLADGDLPIPTVTWEWSDQSLEVTAMAAGTTGHSALVVRYRLRNRSNEPRIDTLYLALRPFQVDPPTQFLNAPGGVAPIRDLALDGRVVRANGDRGIESLNTPDEFGAAAFDQGDVVEYLRAGRVPPAVRMPDPFGHASGALAYVLAVEPGGIRDVSILVPLRERPTEPVFGGAESVVKLYVDGLERTTRTHWSRTLGAVGVSLPDTDVVRALKAQLAYVMINRNGVAIQPGSRSYARSWIRDGCLTSTALLRLGQFTDVKRFIQWFVPHQYPNGKAPCCVDARGSDPTPEHDSSGELVYLITTYVRYTGDREFAANIWPHVTSAIAYLDTLRSQRNTPEWSTPANAPFHGILPPSISHEGYSAKPMHSYWDDLFALRAYKDAAWLAAMLGMPERAAIERDRDAFARDLRASIAAAMKSKGIDYVPGCADLGDFDATSTSIAFDPVQAGDVVPHEALVRTYEKYWDFFRRRRDGAEAWDAFTPYEWRNVGAMVHLGWRDRADSVSSWLMGFRRPPAFQHWAEVVWHDERAPHFIGDMPHTWVGTDFVRSQLDRLAYEDESDSSLVIGAGIPERWLADSGVVVRNLHTRWGTLSYTMRKEAPGSITCSVEAGDLRVPPGGIVVRPPLGTVSFDEPTVNGRPGPERPSYQPKSVALRVQSRLPVTLVWSRHRPDLLFIPRRPRNGGSTFSYDESPEDSSGPVVRLVTPTAPTAPTRRRRN